MLDSTDDWLWRWRMSRAGLVPPKPATRLRKGMLIGFGLGVAVSTFVGAWL